MVILAHLGTLGLAIGKEPWVWAFDPLQLLTIALAALAYGRRVATLQRHGRPVRRVKQLLFYSGIAVLVLAFVSPVDFLGESRLLFAHMIQHILIAEVGALLVVAGLTGSILRPILALPYVGGLRVLAHPFVALPTWALTLYLWHIPALYQAALTSDSLHAFQHMSFFATGAMMWAALLEPLPGPVWFGAGPKAAYVAVVRFAEAILANVFVWSSQPFYPFYAEQERLWGISAIGDQNIGGGIMMVYGTVLTLSLFAWLFLRWMQEGERAETLVQEGVNPQAAARAARYGR